MLTWIIRAVILAAGPLITYYQISHTTQGLLIGLGASTVIVLIEMFLQTIPLDTLFAAVIGIILGVVTAEILDFTVYRLFDNPDVYKSFKGYLILVKALLVYLGVVLAVKKKSEVDLLDRDILKRGGPAREKELIILDTSAVIDGRIADIAETQFISGVLVTPRFVLSELQTLADSGDTYKRSKARRGLDIIARLQKNEAVTVKIFDKDYPEIKGVDAKLLQLSKELKAKIITTDFNLNKVASLQGATVLNINDLSNALKPLYLPGEAMPIYLVKEGKEHKQAIGYLDDGTMVVVEEGRRFVGRRISVIVSSILQTSSGRLVFAKPSQEAIHEAAKEAREGKKPQPEPLWEIPKDVKEAREAQERPPRQEQQPREGREGREQREPREGREGREQRENREPREGREPREPREPKEPRGEQQGRREQQQQQQRDNRQRQEGRGRQGGDQQQQQQRGQQQGQGQREQREGRERRENRGQRENRQPREGREGRQGQMTREQRNAQRQEQRQERQERQAQQQSLPMTEHALPEAPAEKRPEQNQEPRKDVWFPPIDEPRPSEQRNVPEERHTPEATGGTQAPAEERRDDSEGQDRKE